MDIYKQRSFWNGALLVAGLLILLITVFYANYLANELSRSEEKNQKIYVDAQSYIAQNAEYEIDIGLQLSILEKFSLPVIYKDENGDYHGNNWGEEKDTLQPFLEKKFEQKLKSGEQPIVGEGNAIGEIFVFESDLYNYIRFFPWLQSVMITIFVIFGYYLFNSSRKAEQNRVWAGMAKETAHQLGTPISAILAWIEFLKESNEDNPEQLEVIGELRSDVTRLELIADRFSKIGSAPELEKTNLYDQLSDIEAYMKRRSPRRVVFDFPDANETKDVLVNQHLFSWVLENLIRNALDALDGEGTIKAQVQDDEKWVTILLSDTGSGIPSSKFKEVFKPGVSTKKRGWGLGLSLAKRIIEEYHKGKIFVKASKINEGTTFAIQLPVI